MAKVQLDPLAPVQGDVNITYSVKLLEDNSPSQLEADLNVFIQITLPALPNNAVLIQGIEYSSAQESNNTISYSAMVRYATYG